MGYGNPPDEPETGAGSDAPPPVAPITKDAGSVVPSFTTRRAESPLAEYLLRIGDDRLVLGHRLSEWCGHAPILEEDIALANIALDCVGQAALLLKLAGEVEGKGRSEDDLAYFRDEPDFRNAWMFEQPNGDFAHTIARQLFVSTYLVELYRHLEQSTDATLAAIAAKASKEVDYHRDHAVQWTLRLAGGTDESRRRMIRAVEQTWPYVDELFHDDELVSRLADQGVAPLPSSLRPAFDAVVDQVFAEAELARPEGRLAFVASGGGREGRHTEHLGPMLAEMQVLARAHPGASW